MLWEQGVASSNLAVPIAVNGLNKPITSIPATVVTRSVRLRDTRRTHQQQLGHTSAVMSLDVYVAAVRPGGLGGTGDRRP